MPICLCYCFWWVWPGVSKVSKITSLQYLRSISRKRGGIDVIFSMKTNIKVFWKLIVSFLLVIARPAQITQNGKFAKSAISQERSEGWSWWPSQFSINRYCHFLWVWPAIPKVLKITCIQCLQYLKKELSYEVDVLHADKQNLLQVDSIIFEVFDLRGPKYLGKFAISLWHLKKEVRNEISDLTALTGSNIALTVYHISNVLPPFTLFFFSIPSLFFYMSNCLCNISLLLLFDITVGPCKLAGFFLFWFRISGYM